MGRNSDPSTEGYNAGQSGASSDDNPYSRGPASRTFDECITVFVERFEALRVQRYWRSQRFPRLGPDWR